VRELRNAIDRLAVFSDDDLITRETIHAVLGNKKICAETENFAAQVLQLEVENKLEFVRCALIREAMNRAEGNKTAAARLLGVHRKVIERGLKGEA
jgi:two-component system response regulator HydG